MDRFAALVTIQTITIIINTACRGRGTSWRQHGELQCAVTVVDILQTLRDNAEDTSCGETGAAAYTANILPGPHPTPRLFAS